jgi:hypothetical protein
MCTLGTGCGVEYTEEEKAILKLEDVEVNADRCATSKKLHSLYRLLTASAEDQPLA